MTISSVTSKVIYVGDAATATLAYPFRILAEGDLTVSRYVTLTSVASVLTLTTDYTVTGAGVAGGGNVLLTGSYASGMPTGSNTVIQRVVDLTQAVDYVENDAFPAETHENAIDKLCMSTQQLQEQVYRAVLSDINQTSSNVNYADFVTQSNAATSSATVSVAQAILASDYAGAIDFSKDTDGLLTSNSDLFVASQKATKTYVDANSFNTASPTFTGTTNVTTLVGTLVSTTSVWVTTSANFSTVEASGDIFTAPWVDYGGTSTVTGWSATPTKQIYYKKIGKLVFVNVYISGTSNTTAIQFTLPYTAYNMTGNFESSGLGQDNGVAISTSPCRVSLAGNSATVNCYSDAVDGTWTNSGAKYIQATFWYEATT